jgi:hypothetical protein
MGSICVAQQFWDVGIPFLKFVTTEKLMSIYATPQVLPIRT